MKKSRMLRLRITLVVASAILVLFSAILYFTSSILVNYIQDDSFEHYQMLADNTTERINTWFSNEAQIVESQKAAIEIKDDYDPASLTAYLTRIVEDYNEKNYIYDLYFVGTDNVMSSGYGYVPDPSIDFRERPWYIGALMSNDLYYSSPYKDSNLDKYVVTISTPVRNSKGELKGVLALDVFVDTLFDIVRSTSMPVNCYAFMLDSNLRIVTHPYEGFGYVDEHPRDIKDIPGDIYYNLYSALYGGGSDEIRVLKDYDGLDRSLFISKIDCCGWYVVAAIDSDVLYRPLFELAIIIVFALVFTLALGILMTSLGTRNLIRSVEDARKAADEANLTKSEFLASMSHEIRTPINAVIGMNEMILRENKDPDINDYASDIASASRNLTTIVNDILDFSKIESGKLEIVKGEFSIYPIVNDMINMSMSRLADKKLKLFFRIDPALPSGIIGDERRIKQIILNLMTNGIKYTNTGYVTLDIRFSKQDYGINLDISVKDSGIGITEENLNKLFNSFMRVDTMRNRSIEGTGLGLAITKSLVNSMGGFINVTSKYGVGSEFKVSLPLKVSDPEEQVTVKDPEAVKVLFVFALDKLDYVTRKEAKSILSDMASKLNVDYLIAEKTDELESMLKDSSFTHIFVEKNIYAENRSLFEDLPQKPNINVVLDRTDKSEFGEGIGIVHNPFHLYSLAGVLNNLSGISPVKHDVALSFTSPEAKILIVDDSKINLKVASGLLRPYGMQITTCTSGKEAVGIVKEHPEFTLIFMDHMMPEMDGEQTLKAIRELGRVDDDGYYRDVPVIALTANALADSRKKFLELGFDDFLPKPVDVALLDKILRKHIPSSMIIEGSDRTVLDPGHVGSDTDLFVPEKGIGYMGGDNELYIDILREYVSDGKEMLRMINEYYEKSDYNNYVIKVHALKSTSLTIGAEPLSALLRTLETAGKDRNTDVIAELHGEFVSMYGSVLGAAGEYLLKCGAGLEDPEEASFIADVIPDEDRPFVRNVAGRLLEACENFDSDAAAAIYEEACAEGITGDYFKKIIALIDEFEYEKAEDLLKGMIGK
ncbi:MAG: response regulator [Clostridiales bacterium]|nr:response regulator [Clostridiales bacterium]